MYVTITCRVLDITSTTSSMEQNPSREADSRSAGQEMAHLLWNLNTCHQPLGLILNKFNPVHAVAAYFSKIRFNVILIYESVSKVASTFHIFWPEFHLLHAYYISSSLIWSP
jgi:hypothetical protein